MAWPALTDNEPNTTRHNVFGRLLTLKHQVESNEYQPQPLLKMDIAKPASGKRSLAVPTVSDRILQTAATRILAPILDKHREEASYTYRAGRSVRLHFSFQALDELRLEGFAGSTWHGALGHALARV
jgi:hypothetical protein